MAHRADIQRVLIKERCDTGPMQFVDDWPGVFIRGDEALHYAAVIEMVMRGNDELKRNSILASLAALLKSCRVPQEAG